MSWSLARVCFFFYRQETLFHIIFLHPSVKVGTDDYLGNITKCRGGPTLKEGVVILPVSQSLFAGDPVTD